MIKIPLTQGQFALIDDEDFPLVNQYKWYANRNGEAYKRNKPYSFYAVAHSYEHGKKVRLYMHRLIMNVQPGQEVDHVDMNGLNNMRANLRNCSRSLNNANRKSVRGTSKFRGVYWCKDQKKWRATITFKRKPIKLGRFECETEAARAYDKRARELFGEFARTNF